MSERGSRGGGRGGGNGGRANDGRANDGERGNGVAIEVLEEALEHLVRGIVEHPDDVSVRPRRQRFGRMLEVRVHPDDLGKVIGRGGRTATALRTVISALGGGNVRVDLVDVDRLR